MRRILIITNLFPSSREPVRGLYVKQLADSLKSSDEVRVIAPVPWLPRVIARRWRPALDVPREEVIDGIVVHHPRYVVIPRILRFTHALTFAACIKGALRALRGVYDFQLISVHWIYPDAVGTMLATRKLDIPVVAHALGCDINDYLRFPLRRRMIGWSLRQSSAIVTKSAEIADKIVALGVDRRKIHTIYNGVNRELFFPRDKKAQRSLLSLPAEAEIALFIGNFSIEKGTTYLLHAVAALHKTRPKLMLLMIGDGPMRAQVEAEIAELELQGCTRLLGQVRHERIPTYLSAVDVLCLPSLREGCPNVVLESLACGTAVVASAVGAIPEMMRRTKIGFLVEPGDVPGLSEGLSKALTLPADSARDFDWPTWKQNAENIHQVFAQCLHGSLAEAASTQ